MKCNNLAEALALIANKHGTDTLLSPRLPSYLSDYLPKGKGEYNFLTNAFELDIPGKLRDSLTKPPEERQIILMRCVSQMAQDYFIAKEIAEGYLWAFAEALGWEKGPDAQAQFQAGEQYYKNGDYAQAFDCYQTATEQNHAGAQYMLGYCYYSGNGVNRDYVQAIEWFETAAAQGNASAQTMLGNCYYSGLGVNKDLAQAEQWYTKAAEQGNRAAKEMLAKLRKAPDTVKPPQTVLDLPYTDTFDGRPIYKPEHRPILFRSRADNERTVEDLMREETEFINYDFSNIHFTSAIPEKKLNAAIEKYAVGMTREEYPILLYDSTLIGSGKEGCLLTNKALYFPRTMAKPVRLAIEDITCVYYRDPTEKRLSGRACVVETPAKEYTDISLTGVKALDGDKEEAYGLFCAMIDFIMSN